MGKVAGWLLTAILATAGAYAAISWIRSQPPNAPETPDPGPSGISNKPPQTTGEEKKPPEPKKKEPDPIPSPAAPTPSVPSPTPIDASRFSVDNVSLIYNDELLSDASRARLIQIVAQATPTTSWRKVQTTPEDLTEERVIQRNYGIKEEDDPDSYKTLAGLICEQNPDQFAPYPPGTKLRIPPVPAHSDKHKLKGLVRVQTQDTAIVEQKSLSPGASIDIASTPAVHAKANTVENSAASSPVTVIDLPDPSHLISEALRSRELVLPEKVHAISSGGGISILRHRADVPSICTESPSNSVTDSPFWKGVQKSIADATSTPLLRQKLLDRARAAPLVILDWNDAPNVHGSEVEATALYTLHQLNLDFLAPAVDFVELNPKQPDQKKRLMSILDEFAGNYFCTDLTFGCSKEKGKDVDKGKLLTDARSWITDPANPSMGNEFVRLANQQSADSGSNARNFPMHDLVLWAVIWKYFRADSDVSNIVNMSFEVLSGSFAIENPNYLDASHSLGIMAATDGRTAEVLRDIPQAAARDYLKFVNVTSFDGKVLRGFSGQVPVTVIAPDCGYDYKSPALSGVAISPSTRGTSFASPYIATLAWVNTLLNTVGLNEIRYGLIQAGRLSRESSAPRVESGGPIDPAQFLTPRTPYLVQEDGTVRLVHSAHLIFRDTKSNNTLNFDDGASKNETIEIFVKDGEQIARVRSIQPVDDNNPGTNPAAKTTDYKIASDWKYSAIDHEGKSINCGGALPGPSICREIGF